MAHVKGFPPVLGPQPRVLILGSMPSVASLQCQQYYGNPNNAFWAIMGELIGAGPELPYTQRTQRLIDAGIAVWDVLASCVRPGSLDSAIELKTARVNDPVPLMRASPALENIVFNGRKAEQLFRQRLGDQVETVRPTLHYTLMPSTSPAMATLDFQAKLERWRAILPMLEV